MKTKELVDILMGYLIPVLIVDNFAPPPSPLHFYKSPMRHDPYRGWAKFKDEKARATYMKASWELTDVMSDLMVEEDQEAEVDEETAQSLVAKAKSLGTLYVHCEEPKRGV